MFYASTLSEILKFDLGLSICHEFNMMHYVLPQSIMLSISISADRCPPAPTYQFSKLQSPLNSDPGSLLTYECHSGYVWKNGSTAYTSILHVLCYESEWNVTDNECERKI